MSEKLTQIRAEIDALDATLCDLLGARRGLIAQVAATKPDKNMMLMRPAREAQQMRKLAAVAKEKNLPLRGLVAIWRELIGMALTQEGGLEIIAAPQSAAVARAHFGAMLEVAVSENLDDDPTAVAVLPFNKIPSPREGRGVFGLLPIVGQPQAVLYGVAPPEDLQQPVTLVQGAPKKLPDGAARLADDLALLDGAIDAPSGLVRLGIFEAPLIMGEAK